MIQSILSVSDEQLEEVAALIGAQSTVDEAMEAAVVALVQDAMLARRMIDWLPEAFGMVLIAHIDKVTLPATFSARNRNGKWQQFAMSVEPIVGRALALATHMYHNGPRERFSHIARRSALVSVVNQALNEGLSLDDSVLSGPALIGIPAEIYGPAPPSIWKRLTRVFAG